MLIIYQKLYVQWCKQKSLVKKYNYLKRIILFKIIITNSRSQIVAVSLEVRKVIYCCIGNFISCTNKLILLETCEKFCIFQLFHNTHVAFMLLRNGLLLLIYRSHWRVVFNVSQAIFGIEKHRQRSILRRVIVSQNISESYFSFAAYKFSQFWHYSLQKRM